MISVCMATYNGERFIDEQLKCIYNQTLSADEVIICDDASEDHTVDIIENFIVEQKLQDKWRLICNTKRKGYPENFYYCMSLAKGNIVFLADQDDIWSLRKLEEMHKCMIKKENIKVLACKMELIDGDGKEIKTLIKPNYSTGSQKMLQVSMDRVLYKNEWSGMVLAYRNDWYQANGYKIETSQLPHDLAICVLAAADNEMYQLDSVLAWHRRHDSNAAKEEHRIEKLLDKKRKLNEIEQYKGYLEIILKNNIVKSGREREAVLFKYEQMRTRGELLKAGKCLPIIKNYLRNPKKIRLFTFLCDFLLCLRNEKDLDNSLR